MKSLNVGKIATAAAGIGLMGAAALGAAVAVPDELGSYKFFSNGAPQVKVVVGSQALASDAVAAGKITAMLGNLAYVSEDVSVSGLDGLSCEGGAAGTTTCTADKSTAKASLTATLPGVDPATKFVIKSYVDDNVDGYADSVRNTSTSYDGTLPVASSDKPKTVTSADTSVLPKRTIDPKGLAVKEEQYAYLFAKTQYDTTDKILKAKNPAVSYKVLFTNPLPLCLDTADSNGCEGDTNYDLKKQTSVKLTFLGKEWVVSNYAANFSAATSVTTAITSVTLAEPYLYAPDMKIGDKISGLPGGEAVELVDIQIFTSGANNAFRVTMKRLDANGNQVGEIIVLSEGDTIEITPAGAEKYTVKLESAVPGVGGNNIAKVSVFKNTLTIGNGAKISGHTDWKGYIYQQPYSSAHGISELGVYQATSSTVDLKKGDSVKLIGGGLDALKFTFDGLEEVTYQTLTFNILASKRFQTDKDSGNYTEAPVVEVTVNGNDNAFKLTDQIDAGSIEMRTNQAWLVLANQTAVSGTPQANAKAGDIWFLKTDGSFGKAVATPAIGANSSISYWYTSSDSSPIYFNVANQSVGGNDGIIFVSEYTEDNAQSTTAANVKLLTDASFGDANVGNFVNVIGTDTSDKVAYMGTTQYAGFTTRSGMIFDSIGSKTIRFKYPSVIAHGLYSLTVGAGASGANTKDCGALAVGAECDLGNGYKVKVSTVDVTATASATGGAAGGVSGTEGVSASLSQADRVFPLEQKASPIVVLDSDASDTEPLIVVGGPAVNSVALRVLGAADAITPTTGGMVKVVGGESGRIVVAGYTAQETMEAADALVAWLAQNRNAVRG